MSTNQITLKIVPGKIAPRELGVFVELHTVHITEQGTEAGLPIVDVVGTLPDGTAVWFSLTGRVVNAISAAVRGVNQRIHGVDEP